MDNFEGNRIDFSEDLSMLMKNMYKKMFLANLNCRGCVL